MDKMNKFKEAASLMPGSIIIFRWTQNEHMELLYYSENARQITGMSGQEVEQMVSVNALDMILKDDHKVIAQKIDEAVQSKKELDLIYRQHHKDQGIIWIHMKANIIDFEEGIPVFLATMLDVTNEMLNSSSIMESFDRSICVIEKNSKLLLYANSKFYSLADIKQSESLGIYCYEALCGNPAFKNDNDCLCFSTINIEKPLEYYNPDNEKYLSMYGREIMWGEHEAYVFFITDQTEEKHKEKLLHNAQDRFEMTLDNSNLFIWEYDMVNHLCINPDKAVREYGLPKIIENYPETLYDMGHTPSETIAQIKEVKKRLLAGETGFSVERRTINSAGESQWMSVKYSVEKDENGKPVRALVCGTDITEQKEKEAHYEEELRRKKMVASDTKIFAIIDLTENLVVDDGAGNEEFSSLLSDGGTIDDIMKQVREHFVAERDQEKYRIYFNRDKMLQNYQKGKMHESLRHQFQRIPGWYESSYDMILNPSNGHVEAIATLKNVSEIVRTEQIVNRIAAIEYDAIITTEVETGKTYRFDATAGAGMKEHGQSTKVQNADEYAEYFQKYCIPEDLERVVEETSKEKVLENIEKASTYTVIYTINRDGKIQHKRNIFTYLDESHTEVLCVRQDITEIFEKEEAQKEKLAMALKNAEAANYAKSEFLARMSHDLRTPINAIVGLAALTLDDAKDVGMVRENMTKMQSASIFMLNLVNDLLDMAKIEDKSMKLNMEPFTYSDFELELKAMFQPLCKEKNIDLSFEVGPQNPTVKTDKRRVKQVFHNILSNAVKYTPVGGTITYNFGEHHIDGNRFYCEYIIKDNGIGMSEEYQKHLFEPFAQEDQTVTAELQGTGLGLSITKQLVEMMGGHIEIESQKDVGTTVHIFLDFEILEMDTKKEIVHKEGKLMTEDLKGRLVLLAEDHPLNCNTSNY